MKLTGIAKEKYLKKICMDSSSFRIQITPEGTLCYEGKKSIAVTDFIAVHDGKLWGRSGMIWLPSAPLPEKAVTLCVFALNRLAVFSEDGTVDGISPKKVIDPGTSFLLCAKFPAVIRLLIADQAVGKQHITLTLCRDENGEAFCRALIQQFVQHRLPDRLNTLQILLNGGEDL